MSAEASRPRPQRFVTPCRRMKPMTVSLARRGRMPPSSLWTIVPTMSGSTPGTMRSRAATVRSDPRARIAAYSVTSSAADCDNPEAARRLRTRLETALRRLGANPAIGAQRPALAEARYRFLSYQRFSLSAGLHSSAPVCAASVAMRLCFLLPFWNSYFLPARRIVTREGRDAPARSAEKRGRLGALPRARSGRTRPAAGVLASPYGKGFASGARSLPRQRSGGYFDKEIRLSVSSWRGVWGRFFGQRGTQAHGDYEQNQECT